jgi:hypothetical protein
MLNKNVIKRLQAALTKYKRSNSNTNNQKNYKTSKLALIKQAMNLYKIIQTGRSKINYKTTLSSILKRINNNK